MEKLISFMAENPRRLFVMDALGAILTALIIGVVMPRFPEAFIVPRYILHLLAGIATVLALYSATCSLMLFRQFNPYLLAICLANLMYSILAFILVLYFFQQLSMFAVIYFLLEATIIIALAYIELSVCMRLRTS